MLGQDRGRRRGGPDPVRPARGTDRRRSGRLQVPAGAGEPAVGTLSRPAGPATQPPGARSRARLALAHPAGRRRRPRCSSWPSPATTSSASPCSAPPRWPSPSAGSGSAPGSGSAWCSASRSSSRCCPGPASTSAPSPGWRWPSGRPLHLALLGGATALTSRLRFWPVWTAALWVADEALRGRFVLDGFPWGRLGFSQTDGPLLALAAYGGVPLVSFAVALIGALLAAAALALVRAWRGRRDGGAGGPPLPRPARRSWSPSLAVPLVGMLAWLPLPGGSLTAGGPTSTVAVIQGDVPRAGLDFNAQRRAVLDNHVQRTLELADAVAAGERAAARRRPLAGEQLRHRPVHATSTPPGRSTGPPRRSTRRSWSARWSRGRGSSSATPRSSGTPTTGPGDTYVKRHPVPLAEYVPARSFFRFFSDKVDLVRRDFVAGDEVGVLEVGGVRLGDLICFEVVYDGLVARRRRRRRRDDRRPDQQRDLRLHRRERPAAGDEPAAGRRVRAAPSSSRPRAASRRSSPPTARSCAPRSCSPPTSSSRTSPSAAPRRSPSAWAPAPEWVLTALGAGALAAAGRCCAGGRRR